MIRAQATTTVHRSSREVLEFVLDLERYRQADTKIRRVTQPILLDDTNVGTTRYWGRMRFTPPVPDLNIVKLTPWTDLTFTSAPRQPGRLFLSFVGRFRCTDTADGCEVTHSYEIQFRRPFRWIYEPLLRDWLPRELDEEMRRLEQILEADKLTGT